MANKIKLKYFTDMNKHAAFNNVKFTSLLNIFKENENVWVEHPAVHKVIFNITKDCNLNVRQMHCSPTYFTHRPTAMTNT